ncbi:hypothetical protein BHM03_00049816 [Ensete ventricosum]|nr:hypothetical protein BHM03_00049816 [Ensete ventricosum]
MFPGDGSRRSEGGTTAFRKLFASNIPRVCLPLSSAAGEPNEPRSAIDTTALYSLESVTVITIATVPDYTGYNLCEVLGSSDGIAHHQLHHQSVSVPSFTTILAETRSTSNMGL